MIDRRPKRPLGTTSSGTVFHRLLFQSLAFLLSATLPVNAADATPRAGAIREIAPCAFAHYGFGTAVDLEGHVLFTEFNHRKIQRWNPVSRWPMQNVGTANESPNAGFSERPDAFRFYFTWSTPPVRKPDHKPHMIPRP